MKANPLQIVMNIVMYHDFYANLVQNLHKSIMAEYTEYNIDLKIILHELVII